LVERGVLLPDHRARDDFIQREARAQHGAGSVRDFLELADPRERDESARRLVAPLHVRQKVGAAGDRHGLRPLARENSRGFGYGRRRAEAEPGQPHHDATFSLGAGLRGALSALPSPPSQGGSTCMGSGYGTPGKWSGPIRGFSPLAFFSSAASTLSGVIGSSSMRTPTAS